MTARTKPLSEHLLDELEEECLKYLELRHRLRNIPESEERADLEGYIYAWLTQLESTASQAREALDSEIETKDD